MASCAKEETIKVDLSSDIAATFAASEIATRTSSNTWEANDQVGIYMYKSGDTDGTYSLARENVLHTSDISGNFTVDTTLDPIYYPQSDAADFYAYYPYQALTAAGEYTADLTAQELNDGSFDQGAVDFMSASLTGKSKSTDALTFKFEHRLAMLTLIVTPNTSITTLEDVEISLNNIETEATFSPLTGAISTKESTLGSITMLSTETQTDQSNNVTEITATAIVLPGDLSSTAKVTFKFSDTLSHSASFPAGTEFEVGMNHTYNIIVGYHEANFTSGSSIEGWGTSELPSSDTIYSEED